MYEYIVVWLDCMDYEVYDQRQCLCRAVVAGSQRFRLTTWLLLWHSIGSAAVRSWKCPKIRARERSKT